MNGNFGWIKRRIAPMGVAALVIASALVPLIGGPGQVAAGDANRTRLFENRDVRLGFVDGGVATESDIEVSGFETRIVSVEVRLLGITFDGDHSQDMDVMLISPDGLTAFLLSDVGGNTKTQNVAMVLRDEAPSALPADGPLQSGFFRPTNIGDSDTINLDGTVIEPLSNAKLDAFRGSDPNGLWRLIAYDDTTNGSPTAGSGINGGWQLIIVTENLPPKTKPDRFAVAAGRTLRVPAAGVLKNDFDPDEQELTASLVTKPKHGTVKLESDGSFTYRADKTAQGKDTFTYQAEDEDGAKTRETVRIDIK